jgi:steroid 5-alpha reductase family enzyme
MASASRARWVGFAWIGAAYFVAGAVAFSLAPRLAASLPLWQVVALADVAATVVVFAFSVLLDNSSVYDPYWSVAPMVIAPALAVVGSAPQARRALVTALVLVWGARLTYNWARGWHGLAHEDWRYAEHRRRGKGYWVISFVGFHLVPTLLVLGGCASLLPALVTGREPLGALDLAALVVTAGAIGVETVADRQLLAFRRSSPPPERILDTGLWSLSRHPNYLGEIGTWWGLVLFALAADRSAWWAFGGPLAITLLFVFVSVPLLDARSLARRPDYARHMRRVPALLPRLRRRP